MPTVYGAFVMDAFDSGRPEMPHLVLRNHGSESPIVNVRIHSECLTGDVFGSTRCDCGEQLATSLRYIEDNGGVLVYLRQEGRGIGLVNKMKAYNLQDQGMDTVEANNHLGFAADLRNFDVAAQILDVLGVSSVQLMTNNPRKVDTLKAHGVNIEERVPVRSDVQPENERYLGTKARKLGHHIDWLG